MSAPLLYVTGTNTGVGKTTLCVLLLRRARERHLRVAAMKPFCSGGRDDAEQLHALQNAGLTLDQVNPFYFDEPLAPYIAARQSNRVITLQDAIESINHARAFDAPALIEGAGGIMSPLGKRFTLLDIIAEVRGKVCVVGTNMLGVINAALLTNRALSSIGGASGRFVLMDPPEEDFSSTTNAAVIEEWSLLKTSRFPFFRDPSEFLNAKSELDEILDWWTTV